MTYTVSYSGQYGQSGEPLFVITHKKSFIDDVKCKYQDDYPTSRLTAAEMISALFNISNGKPISVAFKIEDISLDFFKNQNDKYI